MSQAAGVRILLVLNLNLNLVTVIGTKFIYCAQKKN
eukprot:SAG31_NODE_10141_length_1178_cov_1.846154_1_plen_35_part_10